MVYNMPPDVRQDSFTFGGLPIADFPDAVR